MTTLAKQKFEEHKQSCEACLKAKRFDEMCSSGRILLRVIMSEQHRGVK